MRSALVDKAAGHALVVGFAHGDNTRLLCRRAHRLQARLALSRSLHFAAGLGLRETRARSGRGAAQAQPSGEPQQQAHILWQRSPPAGLQRTERARPRSWCAHDAKCSDARRGFSTASGSNPRARCCKGLGARRRVAAVSLRARPPAARRRYELAHSPPFPSPYELLGSTTCPA